MKKILLLLSIFIIGIFSFGQPTYAVVVKVTEYIPGANCEIDQESCKCNKDSCNSISDLSCNYKCTIGSGMSGIYSTMGALIKYFTLLAALGGVLFIVINGIQLSMGGMDSGVKESAKKRIVQTISGLVILLLSGVILNAIAPWIYK